MTGISDHVGLVTTVKMINLRNNPMEGSHQVMGNVFRAMLRARPSRTWSMREALPRQGFAHPSRSVFTHTGCGQGATVWRWYAARYSRSVCSRQCGPAASSNGGSHASTLGCEYMVSSDAMLAATMARTVSSRCVEFRAKLDSREA